MASKTQEIVVIAKMQEEVTKDLAKLRKKLNGLQKELKGTAKASTKGAKEAEKHERALRRLDRQAARTGRSFRKLRGGVSGLQMGLVGLGSALGVGLFASAIKDAAMFEGQLGTLGENTDKTVRRLRALKKETGGTYSLKGLVDAEAKIKGFAVPLKLNAKFLKQIEYRAIQFGVSTDFALKSVITGLARSEVRWLDNIGIIVRAKDAQDAYAAANGITNRKLTEQERILALTQAVQAKLNNEQARGASGPVLDALKAQADYTDAILNLKRALIGLAPFLASFMSKLASMSRASITLAKDMRVVWEYAAGNAVAAQEAKKRGEVFLSGRARDRRAFELMKAGGADVRWGLTREDVIRRFREKGLKKHHLGPKALERAIQAEMKKQVGIRQYDPKDPSRTVAPPPQALRVARQMAYDEWAGAAQAEKDIKNLFTYPGGLFDSEKKVGPGGKPKVPRKPKGTKTDPWADIRLSMQLELERLKTKRQSLLVSEKEDAVNTSSLDKKILEKKHDIKMLGLQGKKWAVAYEGVLQQNEAFGAKQKQLDIERKLLRLATQQGTIDSQLAGAKADFAGAEDATSKYAESFMVLRLENLKIEMDLHKKILEIEAKRTAIGNVAADQQIRAAERAAENRRIAAGEKIQDETAKAFREEEAARIETLSMHLDSISSNASGLAPKFSAMAGAMSQFAGHAADSAKAGKLSEEGMIGMIGAVGGGVAEMVDSEKKKAGVLALMEGAAAFAAAATLNFPAAAAHTAAAVMYARVAATSVDTPSGQEEQADKESPEGGGAGTIIVNFTEGIVLGSAQTVGQAVGQAMNAVNGTGMQSGAV